MPTLLLDLPPELTERICAFAVTLPYGIRTFLDNNEHDYILSLDQQPPVTAVCKRLRRESLHHFYRNNTFCIDLTGMGEFDETLVDEAHGWIERLDKANAHQIQRIIFRGEMMIEEPNETGTGVSVINCGLQADVDLLHGKMKMVWSGGDDPHEEEVRKTHTLEEAFEEAMREKQDRRLKFDSFMDFAEAIRWVVGGEVEVSDEDFENARREIGEAIRAV